MANRNAAVFQKILLGKEASPGDGGSDWVQLAMMEGVGSPATSGRAHRGSGGDDAVAVTMGKEHAEWGFEGQANFNDLVYILGAHFGGETPTGGVFDYQPLTFDPETLQTFGIAQGDDDASNRAKKAAYGFARDFRLRATLNEVTMSGQMQSRAIAYGQALPSYDALPAVPLNEADWRVAVGTDIAGPSVTDLDADDGVLEYEFNSTGRLKGQNFADGTRTFADAVRTPSEKMVTLVMEDNSTAQDYMDSLRVGDVYLVKFHCPGPAISSVVNYGFELWTPAQFLGRRDGNQDDLVGATYQLKPIWHPDFLTAGGSVRAVVTTELAGY